MSEKKDRFTLTDEDMKTLLNYSISEEDTQMYRNIYEEQLAAGNVNMEAMFQYAWCLTHSKNHDSLKIASVLFEEIFKEGHEEIKRDSLFYLALAETKQKNYGTAKKYIEAFLTVEKSNVQAEQLRAYIEKHMKSDGIKGMAIVGAMALAGGAVAVVVGTAAIGAALGFSLRSKK